MFQQGLNSLGMMGQAGYDPYEQIRRQQQAMQQGGLYAGAGSGGRYPSKPAIYEEDRRAELARKAEAERAEHNRKLLLLED